jgi:hypothetical protein
MRLLDLWDANSYISYTVAEFFGKDTLPDAVVSDGNSAT